MSTATAVTASPPAGPLSRLLNSSIGNKVVMALSGVVMVGWLVGHLSGNLLTFAGAEALNTYAAWLHATPAVLWGGRITLLVATVLHVLTAIRLKRMNTEARPSRYRYNAHVQSTLGGRTMIYSGLLLLAYAIYHLAHFTWGVEAVMPSEHFRSVIKDAAGRPDVWHMTVWSFQQAPVAIVYIIANVLLGLHLSHGVSSAFQTLGLTSAKWRPAIERVGPMFGTAVAAGFISIPVAVLFGFISLPA
jgi:succinate dehydrogenase / fumarate reductase cytochrome b subunit